MPDEVSESGAPPLTHPDRPLWPGITKRDLAEYWRAVADHALPGIARRPLAVVRCPAGIAGPRFFQKHGFRGMPGAIRAGEALGQPCLAIDDLAGLLGCTQIAAIELHAWGAAERDPAHPDRIVIDLDPGEGVAFPDVSAAALDVQARLERTGLAGFCRTTGGKGLHVVVPLRPDPGSASGWDAARDVARGLAEAMERDVPDRYVASVPKERRRGHILVDWLRNAPGATAVASFVPRARPGAHVATPLAWREVTARLDPGAFTIRSLPARLARLRRDPWEGFGAAARALPGA